MTFNAPAVVETASALSESTAAETLAPTESIVVRADMLQAALLVAAQKDIRYYLNGVFVHAEGDALRVVATDGHHMLVLGAECEKIPEWARPGFILARDELSRALPLLSRQGPTIRIETGVNHEHATLTSGDGFASFRVPRVDGNFVDYRRAMNDNGGTLAHEGVEALRTGAINTKYVKSASDIAVRLGAQSIMPFIGRESATIVLFPGAPQAVLYIMPIRVDDDKQPTNDATIRLLGDGVSASVRALKAHLTRQSSLLNVAKTDKQREEIEARRVSLQERIDRIIAVSSGVRALPHAA